jgi:hypothetical protein
MAGPGLSVTNDTTYADSGTDASVKIHQQNHDAIGGIVNKFDVALGTATSGDSLVWDGTVYAPLALAASPAGWLNVKSYGAVGDGATDNTTVFATLVSAVIAAGGGTIIFPPSTNQYLGSLVLNANVPILVLGYGAILQGPSGGTAVTINTSQTGGGGQTIQLEGLTIRGNTDQTTDGVLIKDTSRARLVNCQIQRTNHAVRISNFTASQNCEGTTLQSTFITDAIYGVFMEIVSGGPSFDETVLADVGINNVTTGVSLPTGSNHVRSCFDVTVWVGRSGTTTGVALYTDADMTRVFGRFGGELYYVATSGTGMKVGPNAAYFDLADLQLHFQGSLNPWADLSAASNGQMAMWRHGLGYYAMSKSSPSAILLGPHMYSLGDTYPRVGMSTGSASNAPFGGGQGGLFFSKDGSAAPDTYLSRLTYSGTPFISTNAVLQVRHGTTTGRPTSGDMDVAAMYYDTTLGKPIWWNGSVWKDAAGTTV